MSLYQSWISLSAATVTASAVSDANTKHNFRVASETEFILYVLLNHYANSNIRFLNMK